MTEVSFNDTQTVFPVQPDQNDSELLFGVEGAKMCLIENSNFW